MSEMQLIMENWRDFGERDKLIENHEYITKVLGIAIPLNESVTHSEKSYQSKSYKSHYFLRAFLTMRLIEVKQGAQALGEKARSAIQDGTAWVKPFGENVGRLMHSLWIIFRNPSMVGEYISTLDE